MANEENSKLSSHQITILIVDDTPEVREMVAMNVEDMGYRCIEAENPEQALQILKGLEEVDLLLSDIRMPNHMNGIELATLAQAEIPNLKVLLTTGAPPSEEEVKGFAVIVKPYRMQELEAKIHELLS